MNEQHLMVKSWAISIAVLVLAYAALSYVRTYSSSVEPGTYRSFTVSGEGKVVAVPDVANFIFSVITEGGKDLISLQKDNTLKTNKIIDFIKSNGVDKKDIKTEGYSVYPKYTDYTCKPYPVPMGASSRGSVGVEMTVPSMPAADYPYPADKVCPPPEISGYTVNQTVSVKIRDFAKAGEILSGAVTNGANSVSQLSFGIDDRDKVESDARSQAIAKAEAKAEAVAKAGGFRLGKLLSIDEGYGGPIYYDKTMSADGWGGAMSEAAPAPSIEAGSQDVIITVSLRYEIR